MKVARTLVTILALTLGFYFATYLVSSPAAQTAIKEPVTEEYYEMLKENAMNVARTMDVNAVNDEAITADFYFYKDELVVTVEAFKAKVTAMIPISSYSLDVEEKTINFKGTAEFENVKYIEKNELQPAWWYIMMAIAGGVLLGLIVHTCIISIWFPTKKE